MLRKVRALFFLIGCICLPRSWRVLLARMIFPGDIGRDVIIGPVWLDCGEVVLGAGSRLSAFSVFRNLRRLELGSHARVGTFNWVYGGYQRGVFKDSPDRASILTLGDSASITSRHLIDCTDRVDIGSYSTVAGFRSVILTHSIDLVENKQACAPTSVGEYCFIGSGCTVLAGVSIASRVVIGAGSVVGRHCDIEGALYAGVPARFKKKLSAATLYFQREVGHVS